MKMFFYCLTALLFLAATQPAVAQITQDDHLSFLQSSSDQSSQPQDFHQPSLAQKVTSEVRNYLQPFFTRQYWRELFGWRISNEPVAMPFPKRQ